MKKSLYNQRLIEILFILSVTIFWEKIFQLEANMLEEMTRKAMHSAWKEARRLEDYAAWEPECYREAREEIVW